MSQGRADVIPVQGIHQVNCRDRSAREVLQEVFPYWLRSRLSGRDPALQFENLQGLGDSVSRLLKSCDSLAAAFGIRAQIADSSGLVGAFVGALPRESHLDLIEEPFS